MGEGLMLVLSDSLLSAHKRLGMRLRSLQDGSASFRICHCVASGCSLMTPWDGRKKIPQSAIGIAAHVLEGKHREIQRLLAGDPAVRVVLVNSAGSVARCRQFGEEYPRFVAGRKRSRLMRRLETPWTICDLEDVVQQRPRKKRFAEVEACSLRINDGFYGDVDDEHFRPEVAKQAENEVLKAIRRTALARYGDCLEKGEIIIVIAAGWNVGDASYSSLDCDGKALLRAELVANAELCALNGHPISAFRDKMQELVRRNRGSHQSFLRQSILKIGPVRPKQCGFVGSKRRRLRA